MSSSPASHLLPVDNASSALDSASEFTKCVHTCSLHTKVDPVHEKQKAALIALLAKTNNALATAQKLAPVAKNMLSTVVAQAHALPAVAAQTAGGVGGLVYLGDRDATAYAKYRRSKGDYLVAKQKASN